MSIHVLLLFSFSFRVVSRITFRSLAFRSFLLFNFFILRVKLQSSVSVPVQFPTSSAATAREQCISVISKIRLMSFIVSCCNSMNLFVFSLNFTRLLESQFTVLRATRRVSPNQFEFVWISGTEIKIN